MDRPQRSQTKQTVEDIVSIRIYSRISFPVEFNEI